MAQHDTDAFLAEFDQLCRNLETADYSMYSEDELRVDFVKTTQLSKEALLRARSALDGCPDRVPLSEVEVSLSQLYALVARTEGLLKAAGAWPKV